MDTVTLSPKYQVVIPQAVREALALRPGEKFQVVSYDGRIELIPVRRMKQTRGLQNQSEGNALRAIAQMKQGVVRDLDEEVALHAARLSFELNLPMVESIVLATARASNAQLWTQDERLRGIEGVQYKEKGRS